MFCFQCEQTAGCSGCTGRAGVCGKTSNTSKLQDKLTGKLIGLARASSGNKTCEQTHRVMIEGLFTTITNVNFNDKTVEEQIKAVEQAKEALIPGCGNCASPCAKNDDYDMEELWNADEDIRSLKSLILFGIRGMAAYAYHAMVLGYMDEEVNAFLYEGMFAVGEDLEMGQLLSVALKVGAVNLKCMELLDRANTETYGTPVPTTVSMMVEKGPFIVVTGHDLKDLELLLKQTEGKGISVYTHGEMLPAHAYPKLKAYSHLKGNFGTAWQNQQKEFAGLPAPVLFTTNCLMPPKDSYRDRVFTTEVVSYPEMVHISETEDKEMEKDFTPVIQKALELGGFEQDTIFTGINGGSQVTTGFGHGAVLGVADTVIEAVKSGAIRHFFLVGGCDGARTGRNYYTEFVKQTPSDTIILTLACGKYRFNDLDLGTIAGLPRILDMGQCNDAYSAIKVAVALAEAFQCDVNELPLSMILSWYEQKAVCILLTLLHLGIKNILLGPSLPAFISPNVWKVLVDNYNIAPISTPEEDLKKIGEK
ncbi:MAG: hydroxylamine reductase [Lachnospiraceae bacterium]|nr:hydroxylamine reductase [Lachnospiraceae bacterium]